MDFDEFKTKNWKQIGKSVQIMAIIYYAEKGNEKLTIEEITKRVELNAKDLEKAMRFCTGTKQVLFTENVSGTRYYLESKTKEGFRKLYDKI